MRVAFIEPNTSHQGKFGKQMPSIENADFLSQYFCSEYATGIPYVCVSTATTKQSAKKK
jgi:hypothetical protein